MKKECFNSLIKKLDLEIIDLNASVRTVKQAAEAMKTDPSNIIKSIVFISEKLGPILVIVTGDSQIDIEKLSNLAGKVRLATPEEVKEFTGFRVGAVPPIGMEIKTIIDRRVLNREYVYGGGGSINKLCKIDPRYIVKYQNAEIVDVSK